MDAHAQQPATPDHPDDVATAVAAYREALARADTAADDALSTETGTDITRLGGTADAATLKRQLGSAHKELNRAKRDALSQQKAARDIVEAKKRELDAMMRALDAELAPLQKRLARLEDGIDAFNLYLGRDEEVIPVREGARAPEATPVTLRQQTLFMDEESALLADDGGIDFSDIDLFVKWLQTDPAHVDQLIPEPKAIVAMRPRRHMKDHGDVDPFTAVEQNKANYVSAWLIRNGEQVHLTRAPFYIGERMMPLANEFTDLFLTRDNDGTLTRITPGTRQWLKAEEVADTLTRRYMKVALILQGLVDRTGVLEPLPEGFSFLEQDTYDRGHAHVVTDSELALGTGRAPFDQWLTDRLGQLTEGMRVLGAFTYGLGFRQYNNDGDPANVRPQGQVPDDGVYPVKAIDDRNFDYSFTFDRGEVYDQDTWERRPAKTRASCRFSASDRFIIPIDTVTVEEIREYLGARTERHAYARMFPLLKRALTFKLEEAEAEQPFRDALTAALLTLDKIASIDETAQQTADRESGELIGWYKTGNKWHRPLNPDDAKASRVILTEARRRRHGRDNDAAAVDQVRAAVLEGTGRAPIVIARRSNDYVAVTPETRRYLEPAAAANVYATVTTHKADGTVTSVKPWQVLRKTQTARWSPLWQSPEWESWQVGANPTQHLSDDEIDQLIEFAATCRPGLALMQVLLAPTGADGDRQSAEAHALFAAADGETAAETPGVNIHITRERGDVRFAAGSIYSSTYRFETDDTPGWEHRYWGRIRPGNEVFTDPAAITREHARWRAWLAGYRANRAKADAVTAMLRDLLSQWENLVWEQRRVRHVDDFGDDEFWEEQKATMRRPQLPQDLWATGMRFSNDVHLADIIRLLFDQGVPPYGRLVRDIVTEHDVDGRLNLPEELLELRFRDAPAPSGS